MSKLFGDSVGVILGAAATKALVAVLAFVS